MNDSERMERLRGFGLSEYGARAYLALLQLGPTEAREVSRKAKIPLAKVYSVLEQIQARGLAGIEPTTPKRYSPVPFAEFLDKLRERHVQEMRELESSQEELSRMFAPAPQALYFGVRGAVRVLKGRRESLGAFRNLLGKATEDVVLAPALGWTARRAHSRTLYEETQARGVQLRMLVHVTDEVLPRLGEFADLVHLRERAFTLQGAEPVEIAIFDGASALITHFLPDDGSTQRGDDVCILIEEAGIVRSLACHMEARWEAAPAVVRLSL